MIAAAGSEDSVKISYDYGRLVTGEEQQVELDLTEEAVQAGGDQEVPDPLDEKEMVVTSAEALVELNLDAVDLVDDTPTFFESTPHEHGELIFVALCCLHYMYVHGHAQCTCTCTSLLLFCTVYIMYFSIFHPLQSCQVPALPPMCQKTWTCQYKVNSLV